MVNAGNLTLAAQLLPYLSLPVQAEEAVSYVNRFLVKRGDEYLSINAQEVACFYSEGRMTVLRTVSNKKFLVSLPIEKLISELLDPVCFFRVNRSTVIAYKSIREILIMSNHRLKVTLGIPYEKEIIVSRYIIQDFKRWLGE